MCMTAEPPGVRIVPVALPRIRTPDRRHHRPRHRRDRSPCRTDGLLIAPPGLSSPTVQRARRSDRNLQSADTAVPRTAPASEPVSRVRLPPVHRDWHRDPPARGGPAAASAAERRTADKGLHDACQERRGQPCLPRPPCRLCAAPPRAGAELSEPRRPGHLAALPLAGSHQLLPRGHAFRHACRPGRRGRQPQPRALAGAGGDAVRVSARHGLRPEHRMLEIGCGNLRAGWRFIGYLDRGTTTASTSRPTYSPPRRTRW